MTKDETIYQLRVDLNEMMLVVEDFLPNIGNCALQNYARLNTAMIAGARNRKVLEEVSLAAAEAWIGGKKYDRYKSIKVYAACKQDWIDESEVKVLDIAEDIQGRDQLTFECPLCGKQHTSLRVG